jgi:hypothetical protein
MQHAMLIQLATLAGYTLTIKCDPYVGEYALRRGDTALTYSSLREVVEFLGGQAELMIELADRLG